MSTSEPSLAALLQQIRACRAAPRPDPEMVALAGALVSPPLAEFAGALASHLWGRAFGAFEATAESIVGNGFFDDMTVELAAAGRAGAEAIVIGTSGGGEEALLMVADARRPGGYVLCAFAYDGMPYAGGTSLEQIGTFDDLTRWLARRS